MEQDRAAVGNGRLRVEFNPPGVHPFVSISLPGREEDWTPAAILGARQVKYSHRGACFPRLIEGGREEEGFSGLTVSTGEEKNGARLIDHRGGFDIETSVRVEDGIPVAHVVHTLQAAEDASVNRVFDRFDFVSVPGAEYGLGLDYCFVPHLRPKGDMVIGEHVFRSPVVLLERSGDLFALIPDLDLLAEGRDDRGCLHYLDFQVSGGENGSPAIVYGFGRSRPTGHVFFDADFKHEIDVERGRPIALGYYLVADRDGWGMEDVVSFMWDRFGRRHMGSGLPQVTSQDRYASAGLSRMFKRADLFRRFNLEGQPCGGTFAMHLATRGGVRLMSFRGLRSYLKLQELTLSAMSFGVRHLIPRPWFVRLLEKYIYLRGPKMPPQILFQSWFNNLRSAYGAYWFARKWRDHELMESALAVKNLAILAPSEDGAFPAVCYATDEGIFWRRGTQGFKHVDYYHTADCATTAYYMALWFRDHEGDPRLLARCREFADFLLKIQLPSGAFPAWVVPADPLPYAMPELRESATSACPAMFLSSLYMIEKDERFLDSARKAAEFLSSEVIPQQKWFDYETFYSCSRKREGMFDVYTGTFPQNTMSMYWCAEAMRLLFLITGEPGYLELGVRVLSHLCLYQQIWNPPFLGINGFGGFGVMNTDGEWSDSRQALFSTLLMDYYGLTGNPEHMERGIAALRASFTLMYLDENRRVAPGNMVSTPEREYGSIAENYGHFGYDMRIPGYLESDWGAGSACQAAAYAQKHYGDVFVDMDGGRAFGINGCRVDDMRRSGEKLSLTITRQIDTGLDVVIKIAGRAPPGLTLEVNGSPAGRTPAGDYVIFL